MTELDRLKQRVDVLEVLERIGVEFEDNFWHAMDDEFPFFCPFCDDAGSRKPAGRANTLKNLWHCWSCGRGGTVIDAVMYAFDLKAAQAVEWLLHKFPDEEVLSDPWAEAE